MLLSKNLKKTAIVSLVVGFIGVPLATYAQSVDNTIITATISSTISMTASENLAINVMPTAGGAQSSNSDEVSVSTNNSAGYTLTLENADADTELSGSNGGEIDAHTGTSASPSVLANNSWGYAVPGHADFDPSYSNLSNAPTSTSVWAGVPALGAQNIINDTTGPADDDITTVWYSVKVDSSKVDGTYTDTVLYTATAK